MSQPPRLVREQALDYCAAAAAHLLRAREQGYPEAVAKGRMTAEAAEAGLAAMRAVAAQWRWVMDPAQPTAPAWDERTGEFGQLNHLLANELRRAAIRARENAAKRPDHFETVEMADLCEALAWYQHDITGSARIVVEIVARRCHRARFAAATADRKAA